MADPQSWSSIDIAYLSVVTSVVLAALFEWCLWLLAFVYCFIQVYQKAERCSTRILAVTVLLVVSILRAVFIPVILVALPWPIEITQKFPRAVVSFLQWFAFWTFSAILTLPWLLCTYQLVTHSFGQTPLVKHIFDETTAPNVIVIVPCYRESPEIILRTVDSIVDSQYPSICIHVFVSFDGDTEEGMYLQTLARLGAPLHKTCGFLSSFDVVYRGLRVTVSKFPHGGKRSCQQNTFALVDRIYERFLENMEARDNLFVLFIDSDCILDELCIQNLMYEMELSPGNKRKLAMTGIVTATAETNSLITLLQDMEYIHGQLFERAVESACGAVTCLPGALTILRFSAFQNLTRHYFADKAEQCTDLFDYLKCHLGEDRWLTHLFMAISHYGQIGMATGAFCKTESIPDFKVLLKQRRRWFLGFISNEACLLTDFRLWLRYPFLCLFRLAQNTIRTTSILFLVSLFALGVSTQQRDGLPVGFLVVTIGLNWALMVYVAILFGRYKIMLYPVLFLIGPVLNWIYVVYGVFTAGRRTWGGPRADAGRSDAITSAQAAVEKAEAEGDDLNVIPETFKFGRECFKTPENEKVPSTLDLALPEGSRAVHISSRLSKQARPIFRLPTPPAAQLRPLLSYEHTDSDPFITKSFRFSDPLENRQFYAP